MVQGWLANHTIELDERVVKENGLVSRVADITHLQQLVFYEQGCDLRMASGLPPENVEFERGSSNFDNMRVKNSIKYVNHGIAAALKVFAEETSRAEVLTTAFLIHSISDWFSIMTSRTLQFSFRKEDEVAYNITIETLI